MRTYVGLIIGLAAMGSLAAPPPPTNDVPPRLLFDVACFGDDCTGVDEILVRAATSLSPKARRSETPAVSSLFSKCIEAGGDTTDVGRCVNALRAGNRGLLSSAVRSGDSDGLVVLLGRRISPTVVYGILIVAGRDETGTSAFTIQRAGRDSGDPYILSGGFASLGRYVGIPWLANLKGLWPAPNGRAIPFGTSTFR